MRFDYDCTKLELFPVLDVNTEILPRARELDNLAVLIVELSPAELVKREVPTAGRLEESRAETYLRSGRP